MADRDSKLALLKLLEEKAQRLKYHQFRLYFPAEGPLSRDKYPKHMEFFKAGKVHKERAFIAANRCGKTISGLYESVCHLTGEYPEWWEGRRFKEPIEMWMVGKTNISTRDVLQVGLLGKNVDLGTGMLPKDKIIRTTSRSGVPDGVQDCFIRHIAGGVSSVGFKSYEQSVGSFMGTSLDLVLLDEEPPSNIYGECLVRTMAKKGLLMITFTPLEGLSEVVMSFLPGGRFPENGVVD